jgi:hypothetical protein
MAKKPDMGSETGVRGRARTVAPQLMTRRTSGQSFVPPPSMYRDPTTKSATPCTQDHSV